MWRDEVEKVLIGVAVGVLVTFAAWLRRRYELKVMNRVPCSCPKCGHVHYIPLPPEDKQNGSPLPRGGL